MPNANGATDNASGSALLLSVAEFAHQHKQKLKYNVVFIAFGAEEVGLQGSKAYVQSLTDNQLKRFSGMINLDTVAGGDTLYVHSASNTAYNCEFLANPSYSNDSTLRDQLLSTAEANKLSHQKHPIEKGFGAGRTGGWSDHRPFACAGIPIAYIEATNFNIHGRQGQDGYSQTTHQHFWQCFDDKAVGPCDKESESKWGEIWHTENDNVKTLEQQLPGRITAQLQQHYQLLTQFLVKEAQ